MAKSPPQSARLSLQQQQQLEALLLQFDRQWTPEAVWSLARRLSGNESLRREALVQLVSVNLEHSWSRGRCPGT